MKPSVLSVIAPISYQVLVAAVADTTDEVFVLTAGSGASAFLAEYGPLRNWDKAGERVLGWTSHGGEIVRLAFLNSAVRYGSVYDAVNPFNELCVHATNEASIALRWCQSQPEVRGDFVRRDGKLRYYYMPNPNWWTCDEGGDYIIYSSIFNSKKATCTPILVDLIIEVTAVEFHGPD